MTILYSIFSLLLVPSITLYIIAARRSEAVRFSAVFFIQCIICAVINRVLTTALSAWIDRLLHWNIQPDTLVYMVIAAVVAVLMALLYEIIIKSFNINLEIKGNKE